MDAILQEDLAITVFGRENPHQEVDGIEDYRHWRSAMQEWGVHVDVDRVAALPGMVGLSSPCPWGLLVERIRAKKPVIIGVNWEGTHINPGGDHAMVIYGVKEYMGKRFVSVMNPGCGGVRYPDIRYEQACDGWGSLVPPYGHPGWRWVNTHTCSKP